MYSPGTTFTPPTNGPDPTTDVANTFANELGFRSAFSNIVSAQNQTLP